jgi:hypothetical protein
MEKRMKKITGIFWIILILGTLTIHAPIRAELLIMKQTETGFAPLDDSDNKNKIKIEQILLKYQWPMSAAFALDPKRERDKILAETGDLFIAGKPNAEEIWIENKIQQETGNNSYRVVFFPTTLYEIFALTVFGQEGDLSFNPDNLLKKYCAEMGSCRRTFDLPPLLKSSDNPDIVKQSVSALYSKSNKFFMGNTNSVHHRINQRLTQHLFELYPELRSSKDSLALSSDLETKIANLIPRFSDKLFPIHHLYTISGLLRAEPEKKIIAHFIDSEYVGRRRNEALIVRGTSVIAVKKDSQKKLVAGSTINVSDESFEIAYRKGEIKPYSVSFGNSLFAGAINDLSACAYIHLGGVLVAPAHLKAVGYTLQINKYDYIKNQNSQLFFIAPLGSIPALFSAGEFFHTRSKAASALKISDFVTVKGIVEAIEDPAGVLLITRDSLKHGALFSQFLADNGQLIQTGDESQLTEEEKQFAENALNAQKEIAGYYKGIKGAKPMWETVLPRVRKNIAERKTGVQELKEIVEKKKAIKMNASLTAGEKEDQLNALRERERVLKEQCQSEGACEIQ